MQTVIIAAQALLGLVFLAAGGSKLVGAKAQAREFDRFGYPRWFMYVTGVVEVEGAIATLVGLFVPALAALAGLWLAVVMSGAVLTLVGAGDPARKLAVPVALLVLSLAVAAARLPELGGVLPTAL